MKMEQLDLFGGEPIEIHTEKEWFKAFVEHYNKIYFEKGDETGLYCCGYHWCCDKCECKLCNVCADCVQTIKTILEENDIKIDYNDFDFEYWERKAKEAFEN